MKQDPAIAATVAYFAGGLHAMTLLYGWPLLGVQDSMATFSHVSATGFHVKLASGLKLAVKVEVVAEPSPGDRSDASAGPEVPR